MNNQESRVSRRPVDPHGTVDELVSLVARLNRLATQQAGLELPFAQVRLLSLIEERGPSRISDLATYDACTQPTMSAQVQRLEAAGLVGRVGDPRDARAVLVSVTPRGRRTLTAARTARADGLAPYFAALHDDELAVLTDAVPVLRRLLAGARQPASPS